MIGPARPLPLAFRCSNSLLTARQDLRHDVGQAHGHLPTHTQPTFLHVHSACQDSPSSCHRRNFPDHSRTFMNGSRRHPCPLLPKQGLGQLPLSLPPAFLLALAFLKLWRQSLRDLTPLAKASVLWFNACYTTPAHKANSHAKKGWESFTNVVPNAVLNRANDIGRRVVLVAWGVPAQRMCERSRIDDARPFRAFVGEWYGS